MEASFSSAVKEQLMMGRKVAWCPDGNLAGITAKTVAEAAAAAVFADDRKKAVVG